MRKQAFIRVGITLWRVQSADMGTWSGLERVQLKTELSSISCSQVGNTYYGVVMTSWKSSCTVHELHA